jgi:hypothetical protein
VAWANALGQSEVAALLQETLDEEKSADQKLSGLAEGGMNEAAAAGDEGEEEDDEEEEESSPAKPSRPSAGRTAKSAKR